MTSGSLTRSSRHDRRYKTRRVTPEVAGLAADSFHLIEVSRLGGTIPPFGCVRLAVPLAARVSATRVKSHMYLSWACPACIPAETVRHLCVVLARGFTVASFFIAWTGRLVPCSVLAAA